MTIEEALDLASCWMSMWTDELAEDDWEDHELHEEERKVCKAFNMILSEFSGRREADDSYSALIERIEKERNELSSKVAKLTFFIGLSPKFKELSEVMKELLKEQNKVMWQYLEVLDKRLTLLKGTDNG